MTSTPASAKWAAAPAQTFITGFADEAIAVTPAGVRDSASCGVAPVAESNAAQVRYERRLFVDIFRNHRLLAL